MVMVGPKVPDQPCTRDAGGSLQPAKAVSSKAAPAQPCIVPPSKPAPSPALPQQGSRHLPPPPVAAAAVTAAATVAAKSAEYGGSAATGRLPSSSEVLKGAAVMAGRSWSGPISTTAAAAVSGTSPAVDSRQPTRNRRPSLESGGTDAGRARPHPASRLGHSLRSLAHAERQQASWAGDAAVAAQEEIRVVVGRDGRQSLEDEALDRWRSPIADDGLAAAGEAREPDHQTRTAPGRGQAFVVAAPLAAAVTAAATEVGAAEKKRAKQRDVLSNGRNGPEPDKGADAAAMERKEDSIGRCVVDGAGGAGADPFAQGLAAVAAAAAAGRQDVLFARGCAAAANGEEEAGGELLFSRTLRRIAGPVADGWPSREISFLQPAPGVAGQLYYLSGPAAAQQTWAMHATPTPLHTGPAADDMGYGFAAAAGVLDGFGQR
jgi:hypothetical protein